MYFIRKVDSKGRGVAQVAVIGTGNDFSDKAVDGMRFMGTHSMNDGRLMWHVFAKESSV